jgi:spore coat polysaccharide biosynthesis protein SpsF
MRKTPEFVMGTVQLGMPYGVVNRFGMPTQAEAVVAIRSALGAGVKYIDTARAYGEAEKRIGLAMTSGYSAVVVTKLDPLSAFGTQTSRPEIKGAVLGSLELSRRALGLEKLQTVLLHRAAQKLTWGGYVWRVLQEQQAAGAIHKIGVSVVTPDEALHALDDDAVEHIQLPFNILDRRWSQAGVIEALRKRPNVVVHVRSVFLQGLLSGDPTGRWPIIEGFDPAKCLAQLHGWSDRYSRAGTLDLCLAYVLGQDWIDGVVLGMETKEQLRENMILFARPPLVAEEISWIDSHPELAPLALVDIPSWPTNRLLAGTS